jgi:hypothetical protein
MIDPKLQRIELEAQIEELENNLPAHSIPPAMIMRLEELEDKLAQLKNEFSGEDHAAA